jgi:hypothetical protein
MDTKYANMARNASALGDTGILSVRDLENAVARDFENAVAHLASNASSLLDSTLRQLPDVAEKV